MADYFRSLENIIWCEFAERWAKGGFPSDFELINGLMGELSREENQ